MYSTLLVSILGDGERTIHGTKFLRPVINFSFSSFHDSRNTKSALIKPNKHQNPKIQQVTPAVPYIDLIIINFL